MKGEYMENKVSTEKKTNGGLYSKVKMSVRAANIMVLSLIAALAAATAIIVSNSGFTVKFDTDGGSYIPPVKAMYSEKITPDEPVKEGWSFTGWYTDRECTESFDISADEITGSTVLYAGWEKTE